MHRQKYSSRIEREINERLENVFKAVIDQQIDENDPPEALETLERLQEEGFTEKEAYILISQVIGMEVAEELAGETGINMDRYIMSLERLPQPFAKPRKGAKEE